MTIQQQNYSNSPFNIPEPPPPYTCAPIESQIFPTNSSNLINNNNNQSIQNNENNKFINQQQQRQDNLYQQTQIPPNPPPPFNLLPPGAVPQQNFHQQQQPGFVPNINPQILPNIQQPNINNNIQQQQQQRPSPQLKIIYAVPLGPHEVNLECSNCKQTIRTKVLNRPGLLSWLICGALALFGCWPCCVLPFCMPSCQDTEHWYV